MQYSLNGTANKTPGDVNTDLDTVLLAFSTWGIVVTAMAWSTGNDATIDCDRAPNETELGENTIEEHLGFDLTQVS